jgi:hypothetical protein
MEMPFPLSKWFQGFRVMPPLGWARWPNGTSAPKNICSNDGPFGKRALPGLRLIQESGARIQEPRPTPAAFRVVLPEEHQVMAGPLQFIISVRGELEEPVMV